MARPENEASRSAEVAQAPGYKWVELSPPVKTDVKDRLFNSQGEDLIPEDGLISHESPTEFATTGLLLELAQRRQLENPSFPTSKNLQLYPAVTIVRSAIKVDVFTTTDPDLGTQAKLFVFSRRSNSTQAEYHKARSMLTTEANVIRVETGREPLPQYATKDKPTI